MTSSNQDVVDIQLAKKAVVRVFGENFNYQDIAANPDKERLDEHEVEIVAYAKTNELQFVATAKTIFNDGVIYSITSNESEVSVTVVQNIHTVSYLESDLIEGACNA